MSRRILVSCLAWVILLTACAEDDQRELRLTRTSTAAAGVRVLADNCPGPANVALLVRNDVLWEVQAPATPQTTAPADGTDDERPGLIEFLVGETPDQWETVIPLTQTVEPGIRYTVRTLPDGQTIDFATPDLQAGLLWDGTGVIQFNPALINEECSTPTNAGAFAQNIAVLAALGTTTAAIVLVILILVLFIITRRFSRVRTISRQSGTPPA